MIFLFQKEQFFYLLENTAINYKNIKKHMKIQISEVLAMRWALSVSVNAQDIKCVWKN